MKPIHAISNINIAVGSAQTVAALSICLFLCIIVLGDACRFHPYNVSAGKLNFYADTILQADSPIPFETTAINIKSEPLPIFKPRRIFPRAFDAPIQDPLAFIPSIKTPSDVNEPYIIKILLRNSILSTKMARRAP